MKILINAASAKSGGAATYIRNLGSEFAQMGHQYQYIFYVPAIQARAMKVLGSNTRVLETDVGYRSSWRRFLWDQVALRRIIEKEGVDLLFSSSDFGMLFPPCKQILMVRNPLFFSQVYLETVLPLKSLPFRLEFAIRRSLISLSVRSSDVVITASRNMMEDLKRFTSIPDGKAVVNSFGVPLERFSWHYSSVRKEWQGESDKPFQILYVSEYSDYKNLTTLLKAVLILREKGRIGFRLVTTADPDQFPEVEIVTRKEDRALASNALVAPFVRFTGYVPYEDIPKLYTQSDSFVFPSVAESFGHPLVEAMASGLPTIASDIPICREICGDAAVYFSPLDPKDLAEKIVLLWNNRGLRRRLAQIGRKRAEAHFDWKNHVRRLVEIIEQVAGEARG